MKKEKYMNWIFSIDEVSNGVYQITATDNKGRKIELTGIDVEQLISKCKKAILDINESIKK